MFSGNKYYFKLFMTVNTSILIPARLMSTRFPRKPLALIDGIPMVIYCAKNAISTGLPVYVCTDSEEIKSVCESYFINVILTPECNSGTDRVAIATNQIETDYVINLQGDEPLIGSNSLLKIISMVPILDTKENSIISGVEPINSKEALDPNEAKCALVQSNSKIQYLSRQPLINNIEGSSDPLYFKQLGLYAFSVKSLRKFASLPVGKLEKAEGLELLRGLENEFTIFPCIINDQTTSVDTQSDLNKVISKIKRN